MKAQDAALETVEVYECGSDCIRDAYGMVYKRDVSGEEPTGPFHYVPVQDTEADMITVERCECSDGFVNGAAIFHNHDVAEVQACNMCQRFACDEDACEAYVAALNRELGELHFVRVQANVGRDEHGTRFVPSIGLRARRARREGLSHDELAAELSRLGIKTGEGERATESASVVLFRSRGDGFEAIADVSVEIDGDELKSDDGDNIRTYTKCAGDIRLWDRRGFQGWKRLNKFDEEVFVFTECQ